MQDLMNKINKELSDFNEKNINEFNEAVQVIENNNERIAELENALEESNKILIIQNKAITKQAQSEKNLVLNHKDLVNQSIARELETKTLKHQIEVLKKDAKTTKEQIKRNKAASVLKDAKIKRLEKKTPATNKTALNELITVYSGAHEELLVYPIKQSLGIDGKKQDQICLLYTNMSGCFITAFLTNDDEIAFSTFINHGSEIADRTKALINKHTMRISDKASEFAYQWLVRVNRIQKMKINNVDLILVKG